MDDNMLIEQYWSRDEQAVQNTDKMYGPYCRSITNNILHNRQDSEECVNDTYLKTWNSIPFDRPVCFSAYLGKIARGIAINCYNKRHAQKRGGGEMELLFEELEDCIPSNRD